MLIFLYCNNLGFSYPKLDGSLKKIFFKCYLSACFLFNQDFRLQNIDNIDHEVQEAKLNLTMRSQANRNFDGNM